MSDEVWRDQQPHLARLAEVRHKKISSLLEFGRYDDVAYTIHDYVEGRRLTEILAERGQLSLSEFVPVVSQISMGVADAHLRGLVVGGIRPEDVTIFEHDGRSLVVKLRDFGLTALPGMETGPRGITDESSDFWPPEVDRLADPSSDVFGLAALCIRMLDGALPTFEPGQDRAAQLQSRLEPMKRANGSLPDEFITLLRCALDPDPSLRPADANSLFEGLIDAVPMSAFRLPRVGQSARDAGPSSASASTSAMTLLAGHWNEDIDDTPTASERPLPPVLSSPAPRRQRRGWVVALAALVIVATGTTLGLAARSSAHEPGTASEDAPPVAVGHAPAPEATPARVVSSPAPVVEAPVLAPARPPAVVTPKPQVAAAPRIPAEPAPPQQPAAPELEGEPLSSRTMARPRKGNRKAPTAQPHDDRPEPPRAAPPVSRSSVLLGRDSSGGMEPTSTTDDDEPLLSRSAHD